MKLYLKYSRLFFSGHGVVVGTLPWNKSISLPATDVSTEYDSLMKGTFHIFRLIPFVETQTFFTCGALLEQSRVDTANVDTSISLSLATNAYNNQTAPCQNSTIVNIPMITVVFKPSRTQLIKIVVYESRQFRLLRLIILAHIKQFKCFAAV